MRSGYASAALFLLSCTPRSEPISVDPVTAPAPPAPPPRPPRQLAELVRAGMQDRPPSPEDIARLQYSQCEPGQVRSCGFSIPAPVGKNWGPFMHCRPTPSGALMFDRSDCATPLVVAFDDAPVEFTRAPGDFTVGDERRTEWVSPRTPWLALDIDGSGCVEGERELFGADAEAVNGFVKLAKLDDNGDGRIDAADRAYGRLALWRDGNQDKACAAGEMVPLAAAGVVSIDLGYRPSAPGLAGSHEGEHAAMTYVDSAGHRRAGRIVDVYLAPL